MLSRRLLQWAVGITSLTPTLGGALYLLFGVEAVGMTTGRELSLAASGDSWALVDYMVRAMAGVWFASGIAGFCIIPSIERHTTWFRILCLGTLMMAVGRLLSIRAFGMTEGNSTVAIALEIVIPVVLVIWQARVAKGAKT